MEMCCYISKCVECGKYVGVIDYEGRTYPKRPCSNCFMMKKILEMIKNE